MATPGTIGAGDRLGATLALSAIAFGVLILGVGFARDLAAPVTPTLDVILTQTRTDEAPENADFIAQANNRGGGQSERAERPREAQLGHVPKPEAGVAPETMIAQAPPVEPEPTPRVLTTTGARRQRRRLGLALVFRAPSRSSRAWRWRGWPPRSSDARS